MDPIDELRRQLNSSWNDSVSISKPKIEESETIIDLNKNLSEQTGYSNALLRHIEDLEISYSSTQSQVLSKENEIIQLRDLLKDSQNCIIDLQKKLLSAESERVRVSQLCMSLNEENNQGSKEVDRILAENKVYVSKLQQSSTTETSLREQIIRLEASVQSLHHAEQEANRIGSSVNARLKFENERLVAKVEEHKQMQLSTQSSFITVRDENLELKKAVERLIKQLNEETLAKEESEKRNKSIAALNVSLSSELQEMVQKCVAQEQQVSLLGNNMKDSTSKFNAFLEKYEIVEEKLKDTEDLVTKFQRELEDAQEEISHLEHLNEGMRKEKAILIEKHHSQESLMTQKHSDERKVDKDRIDELTNLLLHSSQRIREDKSMYDANVDKLTLQVNEYQASIAQQHKEHELLLNSAIQEKECALQKIEELDGVIREKSNQLKRAENDAEEKQGKLLQDIRNLKDSSISNSNYFILTLTGLQQVVRDLCTDMMTERNKLRVVYTHHMKLRSILVQLTGKTFDENGDIITPVEPGVPSNEIPSTPKDTVGMVDTLSPTPVYHAFASGSGALQPLLHYGESIHQLLVTMVSKYRVVGQDKEKCQTVITDMKKKVSEEQDRVALTQRNCDSAMEQIIMYKKSVVNLQEKVNELTTANKSLSTELLEDKKLSSMHISKLEQQISELTAKNIYLNNDILRMTGEVNRVKANDDCKLEQALDKIKILEDEIFTLREGNHALENRRSELHHELMSAEDKILKLREDLQDLKKSSLQMSDSAADDHKKYVKQIEVMNHTIEQYRTQISSLHQVNKTLQTHRNALVDEIQASRGSAIKTTPGSRHGAVHDSALFQSVNFGTPILLSEVRSAAPSTRLNPHDLENK